MDKEYQYNLLSYLLDQKGKIRQENE